MLMATPLDASQVLVGNANGVGLYIAPLGTALPVDTVTALDPAWTPLGYTTDDGVEQELDVESDDIMAWQDKSPVRTIIKSRIISFKFSLLQWNADTLALYMGSPVPTAKPDGSFVLSLDMNDVPTEHALLVDLNDAGKKIRIGMLRTILTDADSLTLQRGNSAPLGITVKCLAVNGKTGSYIVGPDIAKVTAKASA
jgi:hypothetical protein